MLRRFDFTGNLNTKGLPHGLKKIIAVKPGIDSRKNLRKVSGILKLSSQKTAAWV